MEILSFDLDKNAFRSGILGDELPKADQYTGRISSDLSISLRGTGVDCILGVEHFIDKHTKK